MENKIEEERAMMESLGDCPECGHDLPGVAKLIGGRWQLFCTECRICVIGPRDYAVKCWGLKAQPPAVPTFDAWFKARNFFTFEELHMRSHDRFDASMRRLTEALREYVSEAARVTRGS